MPPELLILAPSPSAAVNAQLQRQYTCHHAWHVPADQRHAWLAQRAPAIRAVFTTGAPARRQSIERSVLDGGGPQGNKLTPIRV